MSHPFEHPSAEGLLKRVAQAFSSGQVYLVTDRQLLFVCGGAVDAKDTSLRKQFLQIAGEKLQGFRVFLAETAAKDVTHHADPRFLNIAEFERLLADVADCILIFPETPGSLTELGYFAALADIRKKCLVVNHFAFQGQESFINNGPLALFDSPDSIMRPTIHIDWTTVPPNLDLVCDRIRGRLATIRRKRINAIAFDSLDGKAKLAVLEELIYRFKILDVDSLLIVLRKVFSSTISVDAVRELVSILISSDYIIRTQADVDFFSPNAADAYRLLTIDGFDVEGLSVAVIDFYQRYAPQIFQVLTGTANDH
jgi:hypothetical protein